MNRGSALLFHLAAESSSSPAVRRLWNVCNLWPDLPPTTPLSLSSHSWERLRTAGFSPDRGSLSGEGLNIHSSGLPTVTTGFIAFSFDIRELIISGFGPGFQGGQYP